MTKYEDPTITYAKMLFNTDDPNDPTVMQAKLAPGYRAEGDDPTDKFISRKSRDYLSRFLAGGIYDHEYDEEDIFPEENQEPPTILDTNERIRELLTNIPEPSDIKGYLDRFVVGQEVAKKTVSTFIVNHLWKCLYNLTETDAEFPLRKSNLLLIGNSGVGKTYLLSLAAKYVGLPFVSIDATKYSATGYVGKEADTMLTQLLHAAQNDLELAQLGIVFVDEFDKLADGGNGASQEKAVNRTDVQYGLLKMVEGTVADIPMELSQHARHIPFDTTNTMFCFAGAFGNMLDKKRRGRKLGFEAEVDKKKRKNIDITEQEIIDYGIIPEILGRIGTFICLDELTEDQLYQILTKVENSVVAQAKTLFKLRGKKYPFKRADYIKIIKEVKKTQLGARGLTRALEKKLAEHLYE